MNFEKYKKIKILGNEENIDIFNNPDDYIIIQEEVDGGNFRFMINNDNIIFGTITTQLTSSTGEEIYVNKNFQSCINLLKEKIKNKNLKKYEGYIFFGENMVKHSLDYDWEKIPRFLGFDIKDLKKNEYLHYYEVKEIYKKLDLDMVPLVDIKKSKRH